MDIKGLTTQQKSVMLAKLMGWKVANKPLRDGNWKRVIADKDGNDLEVMVVGGGILPVETELKPGWIPDLYEPKNMAAAWRVLNWSREQSTQVQFPFGGEYYPASISSVVYDWYYEIADTTKMPPAVAQAAWLDKILELAIEAGLAEQD